ncbi:MAG: sel1 repeat family protein [Aquamicrobium sp.]|uniref:SEL1-like repeat protein n=1 Tax=Aquamicrobium sp. TaxID=1872579 RepID=UPI00349EC38E|nr:sel1 repeat family protein [Aquamicrobium sp.]
MKPSHVVSLLGAILAIAHLPAVAAEEPKPAAQELRPSVDTGSGAAKADTPSVPPVTGAPAVDVDPSAKEGTSAAPATPSLPPAIDPNRFGERLPDAVFGAYQRGEYITAYKLALPRAQAGNPAAMTLIAEIYARGLGVPKNEKEAAAWYARASDAGVPEAQFQYALLLIDGRLVKRDDKRARELMQAAADAGNRLAQFNLAQMIIDREPGPSGQLKAVEYYMKATEAGLADAQYAVAQVYANGMGGITVDLPEARKWLLLAARQNFDTAQVDLASWLVEGKGGPRDMKAGFGWMRRAALGGNVAAQNRLAKLYVGGLGVEPDAIEGAAWYIRARRAGLVDYYMEDVMNGLTDEETKQAIERANRLR